MVARCGGSRWDRRRRRRGGIRPWWRRCPATATSSGEIRRRHGRSCGNTPRSWSSFYNILLCISSVILIQINIIRAQINKNKFASNLLWNILWFAKARESVNLSLIFSKRV